MSTNLIASGNTEASSADFTLTTDQANIHLTPGAGLTGLPYNSAVQIQIKTGTVYMTVGTLTDQVPALVLQAAGTYRVFRQACSNGSYSVDRD